MTRPVVTLVTANFAPEITGVAVYTTHLARGLRNAGCSVRVVTAPPHYPEWRVRPKREWRRIRPTTGVQVHRVSSYVPSKPVPVARFAFEALLGLRFATSRPVRRSLQESDLIIFLSPALIASGIVRCLLPARAGRDATKVLWVQDRYSEGVSQLHSGAGGATARALAWIERTVAGSCDDVVVIHEDWRKECAAQWGMSPDRFHVVQNWATARPAVVSDVESTRRGLGWGATGREIVVLHAGNMGVKQDLGNVVSAGRLAEAEAAPVRFVLLGGGSQRDRLELAAAGCPNVQFLDHLDEAAFRAALASADLLLVNEIPGMLSTAIPSKLTSYFAAGRPVLAATSRDSVTAHEVRSSGAGRVIEPGVPEALLRASLAQHEIDPQATEAYLKKRLSAERAIQFFLQLAERARIRSAHRKAQA